MDVFSYYLRKKRIVNRAMVTQKFTTCDTVTINHIKSAWKDYKKNGTLNLAAHDSLGTKILLGHGMRCNWPWADVDYLYAPLLIEGLEHWVLAVVDLRNRVVRVYDSMNGKPSHNKRVEAEVRIFCDIIPPLMAELGIGTDNQPFLFEAIKDVPLQDNGGDCGMFVFKWAEFLVENRSVSDVDQKRITYFRKKLAFELHNHGVQKYTDGLYSDDVTEVGD